MSNMGKMPYDGKNVCRIPSLGGSGSQWASLINGSFYHYKFDVFSTNKDDVLLCNRFVGGGTLFLAFVEFQK